MATLPGHPARVRATTRRGRERVAPWADAEVRSLYRLVERRVETVDGVRELIAVPPRVEKTLEAYARQNPDQACWVGQVLRFRRTVLEKFELLLIARGEEKTYSASGDSSTNIMDHVNINFTPIDHAARHAFEAMCASGRSHGYDFGSVTLASNDGDLLALAFAEESTRQDLRVIPFWEKSSVRPAWYAAMVNSGVTFEVTLFLVTSEPHRHMFLGSDVKSGVKKACEIMNDRSGASWNPSLLSSDG